MITPLITPHLLVVTCLKQTRTSRTVDVSREITMAPAVTMVTRRRMVTIESERGIIIVREDTKVVNCLIK